MRLNIALAACALCVGGCAQQSTKAEERPSETKAFIQWASDHAVALDSLDPTSSGTGLEPLRESLGSARLVGLGESRHDTREQLLLKGRLVRYLIEDLAFRALILEESLPHAESLDRYVLSGEGELRDLMNNLAGWYLLDTEEMLEIIKWIRQFNQDLEPGQKVRIFGVDITAPTPGIRAVIASLKSTEADILLDEPLLGLDLQRGDFWPGTWERYGALSDERRRELAANYEALIELVKEEKEQLIESSSEKEYERILMLAKVGKIGNEFFSSANREASGAIREHGMAQMTLQILGKEIPGEKAILWAHNLHIAKGSFRMPGLMEGALKPMGIELSAELGDAYIAIGGAFGTGSYPPDFPPGERVFEPVSTDIMDGALAAVEEPFFLLDLREIEQNAAAARWLRQERQWKAQDTNALLVPSESFDFVYFVKEISRSQPSPHALQRFQALGQNSSDEVEGDQDD